MNITHNSTKLFCLIFRYPELLIFNNFFALSFNICSIYLSVILFRLLYKRQGLYHANVRLLLLHFCTANGLTSFLIMVRIGYNFALILFGSEPFIMSRLQCTAFDTCFTICNLVALLSISAIGFERFMATVSQKFSDPDYSNVLFKILTACMWFLACVTICANFLEIILEHAKENTCYCLAAVAASSNYQILVFSIFILAQFITLTCFGVVLVKNKQTSKACSNISIYSLQRRYQIWNNVSTTKSLMVNVISNAFLYTIVCIAHIFLWSFFTNHHHHQIELIVHLVSIVNDFISVGCFLQPIFLICFNKKLSKTVFNENEMMKKMKRRFVKDKCETTVRRKSIISYRISPDISTKILENAWDKFTLVKF